MLFNFSNVLIFLIVGIGFVFSSLLISSLLRPNVPTREKLATYECGEIPVENAWVNFNIRFYILAVVFIIFDVEIAFMFPVGAVFKQWIQNGSGLLALGEIGAFVFILLLGLAYVWIKGDLDWVKKVVVPETKNIGSEVVRQASHL